MKIKLISLNFIFLLGLAQKYVAAQSIHINELKIEGNTILTDQIESLVAPYRHQNFDEQQLKKLTRAITNLYVEQGYVTSGAFFPEQEIVDGSLTIRVIEGELENIEIEGLKRLQPDYLNSRLQRAIKPLNVNELKNALELLQLEPLIHKVKAQLVEGTTPSASVLLLEIEEASLLESSITVNNRSSPNIGEIRGVAALTHHNLLGQRDRAFLQYDLSSGLSTYELDYTVPLNLTGTAISLGYRDGESRIIEDPFADVNIRARADTLSLQLIQPIVREQITTSSIGLSFERTVSETFILDTLPFSFTDGPERGRSQLSVFRLSGDWLKRSEKNVLSIKSQLSLGVDLFDVTKNENAPDALFISWLGQFQWARALNQNRELLLVMRLATQLTPDSLLPFEQFTLGGASTVRGYRQNRLLGDNGLAGTVELVATVVNAPSGWGSLQLIPFVDVGAVWNNDGGDFESLTSLGLGLEWQLRDFLTFRLDFGLPLSDVEERGDSLSDSGFSFSLQLKN